MRWFLTFAVAFITVLLWLRPAPAMAGLHFCNKTDRTVGFAIAVTDILAPTESRGWWTLSPSNCTTPIASDLEESSDYYYWAHNDNNSLIWGGAAGHSVGTPVTACVTWDGPTFDIWDSSEPSDCTKESFRYIPVGASRDWTVNITSS